MDSLRRAGPVVSSPSVSAECARRVRPGQRAAYLPAPALFSQYRPDLARKSLLTQGELAISEGGTRQAISKLICGFYAEGFIVSLSDIDAFFIGDPQGLGVPEGGHVIVGIGRARPGRIHDDPGGVFG